MKVWKYWYTIKEDDKVIFEGTSCQIAEKYGVHFSTLCRNNLKGYKVLKKYTVERKPIKVVRVTEKKKKEKVYRMYGKSKQVLMGMCEMYFDTTGECPNDLCEVECSKGMYGVCNKFENATLCWFEYARRKFSKENLHECERAKNEINQG